MVVEKSVKKMLSSLGLKSMIEHIIIKMFIIFIVMKKNSFKLLKLLKSLTKLRKTAREEQMLKRRNVCMGKKKFHQPNFFYMIYNYF